MLHYTPKQYLVINESRIHYFLMDDFNVCRKYDNLLICPPMGSVYNRNTDSCELALFLKKQPVSKLCKTQIVKEFPPIFIKNLQGWIYATSNQIDLTLNFINQTVPKSRHIINDTGLLEVGHGCSIHSDTSSLPVIQSHVTMVPLNIKPYSFSLPLPFTTWEHGFLMNVTNITIPSSNRLEPLPQNNYIDQLQPILKQQNTDAGFPEWTRMGITVLFTLLFVLLAVGLKRARDCWYASRLSNQPEDIQESHKLMPNPPPWTSATCQHH